MDYSTDLISSEQSIAEHTFIYIIAGAMYLYDGSRNYGLQSGEYGIARRNRFVRFKKQKVNNEINKVFVFFDERFLRLFQTKYQIRTSLFDNNDTILFLNDSDRVDNFIHSLLPYYDHGKIAEPFSDLKREELLLILLQNQPSLSGILFDFTEPDRVDIEEFMNRNFSFHVSVQRFAYLTGRSLSAFKRDFYRVFDETPGRWLVRKRLEEAHFLISKCNKMPTDIYIDLGFENLSHFSFAFKKHFGFNPSELMAKSINRTSRACSEASISTS